MFINNKNSFVGISRLGIAIALIINYFIDSSKNRIKIITVDDNSIIFEIKKYSKKNTIIIDRNKIKDLKMFIYSTSPLRICLHFYLKNDIKNEFLDIYYDSVSRNIIKQLFILKKYIPDFSYSIYPESNYIANSLNQYIKNNFKNSLKDNIYNAIIFSVCFFAIIILILLFLSIKYVD